MKFFFSLFGGLFLSSAAFAGVLFEPFVGYDSGKYSATVAGGGAAASASANSGGIEYGGRLGLNRRGFAFGGQYEVTTLGSGGSTVTATDLGAFVGYIPMMGFRIFGGYNFSSQINTGVTGTGYFVAMGYKFARHFAVNLEFMGHAYKDNSILYFGNTFTASNKLTSYGVTVSFPFGH